MKGLVIDDPWVSLIIAGDKTWEMRSRETSVRGRIALIRKGSGTIVGMADLVDCIGPLDAIAWRAHADKHRIPPEDEALATRWNTAWVLERAVRLAAPVPYDHPLGAVIWVNLPDATVARLQPMTDAPRVAGVPRTAALKAIAARMVPILGEPGRASLPSRLVPVANDGSWFSPDLARSGGYTIGAKGEEFVVHDYADALAQLRLMQKARWRRPNPNGNWGIVTGVRWEDAEKLAI